MLRLTRRVTFSAGHVYRGGGLSREELVRNFGLAAEPSGHGHDYVLEVTVAGEVCARDGMVVNINELDAVLRNLVKPLDHRLLNESCPEFRDAVPTTERLAQVLWSRLPRRVGPAAPASLRLQEQPGLHVELYGKELSMVYLTRALEFAASHRLHTPALSEAENVRLYGKCNNPHGHGHNYVVEVTVKGTPDPRTGTVVDLGKLEALLDQEVDARFDHKHLNLDTPYFQQQVASGENIAQVLWGLLEPHIASCRQDGQVRLHNIRLIETPRSWFDYGGEAST